MKEDTKEGTPISIESEPFIRHYSRGFNPSRLLNLIFFNPSRLLNLIIFTILANKAINNVMVHSIKYIGKFSKSKSGFKNAELIRLPACYVRTTRHGSGSPRSTSTTEFVVPHRLR